MRGLDANWPSLPVRELEPVLRPILPRRTTPNCVSDSLRDQPSKRFSPAIQQAPAIASFSAQSSDPVANFVAAVELVVEDRDISEEQKATLDALQADLNLTEDQVRSAKMIFLRGLTASMWDDGEISKHEQFDLGLVAQALGLSETDIEYALSNPLDVGLLNDDYALHRGARVVFTGEMSQARSDWKTRAEKAGLKVTGSVSGKTDWLIVPSSETGSTKSQRARQLGVRVISEQRFLRMIKSLEQSAP